LAGIETRRPPLLPPRIFDWQGEQFQRVAGRRFRLPDGSERYLVDEALLLVLTQELGGQMGDPLKTTVVQNQRCMTTWIVRKN
jgi:tellurite methyltransferase